MTERLHTKRLAAIQKRIDQQQLLFNFVKEHPELYDYTNLQPMTIGVGLEFEERGYIRALWDKTKNRAVLRLERHIHDWEADGDKRVAAEDISSISKTDLAKLLKEEIKVDLSKPPFWEESDDEEEQSGV